MSPYPLDETTYFIRCVRREGCVYMETYPVVITVGNEIDATIERPAMGCAFQTQTYSVSGIDPSAQVSWSFSGPVASATAQGHSVPVTFVGAGYLDVSVTITQNGCTGVFSERVIIGTCLGEGDSFTASFDPSDYTLFPNPVVDVAQLVLPAFEGDDVVVNIYNSANMLVNSYPFVAGTTVVTIDMNGLPAGLYVVKIVGGALDSRTIKVAKQ
ncbi:MAG: T9SS type A sorting domain-containing protein [Saprospiraceae bacterium]